MTDPNPSNLHTSELEVEQEPLSGNQMTWLKELRLVVAAVVIFTTLIEYKAELPDQSIAVDLLALGLIISLAAPMARIPVYRAIAKFIKAILEAS